MLPQPIVQSFVRDVRKYRTGKNLHCITRLYKSICQHGLEDHKLLANEMVIMVIEIGNMSKNHDIVTEPLCCKTYSSDSLDHALSLYQKMQHGSLKPNICTFAALLKACAAMKDITRGCMVHAEIVRDKTLEKDHLLSNILIDMYAKCGCFIDALEVFENVAVQDVVSWTSLMIGYARHDHGEKVLNFFEVMQIHGVQPNSLTYLCCLKACGSLGAAEKGKELHAEIDRKRLWQKDLVLGNALIDMYVKCGSLTKAQEAFVDLPIRDVVSWTTMIAGYANHDRGMEALDCFEKMQAEGVAPNAHTYVCCLKACTILRNVEKGKDIHIDITRKGLLKNVVVGSALIDMYSKCGFLRNASEVFHEFPIQDIISWNALITGYAKHDHAKEALCFFDQMQLKGISPNVITYVAVLKACGSIKAICKGREIHAELSKKSTLERNPLVCSAMIDMYMKCGVLQKAQEVLDNISQRDVVIWNSLIAGYSDHDCNAEVLACLEKMESEGISPDTVTFLCVLKACGSVGASKKGREVHSEVARKGLDESELTLANALIDMYVKCYLLPEADEVLQGLPIQDVVSWTTLIAGCVDQNSGIKALDCFKQMQQEGILPNPVTFVCGLKACGLVGAITKGATIHAEVVKQDLAESNLAVGSALVDMYAKCGCLKKAQEVFDNLKVRDVITWNSLIAGYAQHNYGNEALSCFEKMHLDGVTPNASTFISSLKACSCIKAIEVGQKIHADIDRNGFLQDTSVGNALIDMYAKCGLLTKAQQIFDKLLNQDIVSWNSLIAGYVNFEQSKLALDYFEQMQEEGVIPDAITFISSLKACSNVGSLEKGKEMYAEITWRGFMEKDHVIGNSLVDMYAKFNCLEEAEKIFEKLPNQDLISWNALITSYAQSGENEKALLTFDHMKERGQKPDLATFIGVLNACSHGGFVNKGEVYFYAMSNDYGLSPTLEHYTCMADLLGRAGHIDRVLSLLEKMPWNADVVAWNTMLDACRKWGSMQHGKKAFEQTVNLD